MCTQRTARSSPASPATTSSSSSRSSSRNGSIPPRAYRWRRACALGRAHLTKSCGRISTSEVSTAATRARMPPTSRIALRPSTKPDQRVGPRAASGRGGRRSRRARRRRGDPDLAEGGVDPAAIPARAGSTTPTAVEASGTLTKPGADARDDEARGSDASSPTPGSIPRISSSATPTNRKPGPISKPRRHLVAQPPGDRRGDEDRAREHEEAHADLDRRQAEPGLHVDHQVREQRRTATRRSRTRRSARRRTSACGTA